MDWIFLFGDLGLGGVSVGFVALPEALVGLNVDLVGVGAEFVALHENVVEESRFG
ncbi:hypothetical protein ACXYMX_01915 [Sporosarcina sp. CAU 1771]